MLCHPSAQIGRKVYIGQGTVVMAGAVINSDIVIGEHCIINTHTVMVQYILRRYTQVYRPLFERKNKSCDCCIYVKGKDVI